MNLQNREGQAVPNVTFRTRRDHEWVDVSSDEVFKGKTVVVFALPGAFTPTCSSTHVPRYNQLAPALKRHGVDEIVCVSVNDAFVMNEWQRRAEGRPTSPSCPTATATSAAAWACWCRRRTSASASAPGATRCWCKDGVIEKMFIEPDVPGDPFEVSDADTMLAYIAPNADKPLDVTVFTREGCPFCVRAKGMLRDAGIQFDELVLNRDYSEVTLRAVAGASMVPQVFINGEHIGGSDELEEYLGQREKAAA